MLNELNLRINVDENIKLNEITIQFKKLLVELRQKELPIEQTASINKKIDELNATTVKGDALKKTIKTKQTEIIKLLEKELKLVPKNYYRNLWMPLALAVFGIPLGLVFGASLKNIGFIGLGFPIGMGIGIAVGSAMDKKAFAEGRQIDIEIKH